jgi:hypothetical protein
VCDAQGADHQALVGLAEIARRRGLDEDAAVFEQEAATLVS